MKNFFGSLVLSAFLASSAWASGISKPVLVGPKAIGMGGAFVGIADDPTAIFHNPAALTQLKGNTIELGMDSLITNEDYTPDQTAAPGAPKESANREFLPVPQFAFVTDIAKPIYLGLGIFFPHGNGGKFPGASTVITNPNEGRIYSMEIAPAIAVELFEGFSLGGTIRITRVSSTLKGQLFQVGTAIDTLNDLSLTGWGVGGSVGMFYKPCHFFSLGANYRSKTSVPLDGQAQFAALGNLNASLDQTLPTLITAGIGFLPVDKLTIGLSYDFERNSELKQYDVNLQGIGIVTLPENWKDSHTFHIGAEYRLFPVLALRGGYARDFNQSIPDTVMNRIIGDIDAHEVSGGVSMKWSRYTFSATWNGRFGSRTIPLNGTANLAPGKYEAFVNMLSLGVEAAL